MRYKNIAGRFFGLVTKHACDRRTDRQTDRHNYDSQDRDSIAASTTAVARHARDLWRVTHLSAGQRQATGNQLSCV